jgi:hypothetical protein
MFKFIVYFLNACSKNDDFVINTQLEKELFQVRPEMEFLLLNHLKITDLKFTKWPKVSSKSKTKV